MQKLFVTDDEFEKEFTRGRAKGHKRLIIEDNVEIVKPIELHTNGTDLVVSQVEGVEGDTEVYTALCTEFGLVGGASGFKNKISVIFLDKGWMLVTLYHGALVMNLNDKLMMPTAGDDFAVPKVVTEDICWVNADNLLEYGKYYDLKGQFMYDFELFFVVGGDSINGMRQFSITHLDDEDIDLSLGLFAKYQQQLKARVEAKEALELTRNILHTGSGTDYEYDFDDEEEESEVESEQDEDDEYDFSSYA